jgi:glucosamine--fructose-6-phosphate aminotransferase (isomerizing)
MCGIIGYIGFRNVKSVLIHGLKRLDYRGYDSCGIAFIENKKIKIKKVVGRVKRLEKEIRNLDCFSCMGIAHTRWATHGIVNEKNAHPHFSCDNRIALVHNGIIENYSELRYLLKKEGHNFSSETDTEVIAHLIEKFLNEGENIEDSFVKALELVEGAYAISMIYLKEPEKIFIARKSSPIVIGLGKVRDEKKEKNKRKKEFFVASDISALLPYTKKFIFLKDGELAILSKKNLTVKSLNLKKIKVDPEIVEIKIKAGEISRRGFPNFMKKEIFEQSYTISRAFRGRINKLKDFGSKIKLREEEI